MKPDLIISPPSLPVICKVSGSSDLGKIMTRRIDSERCLKVGGRSRHGERGARAYNGGLGAEPPAGSRGRAPGRRSGGGRSPPLKLKAFCPFSYKRGAIRLPLVYD